MVEADGKVVFRGERIPAEEFVSRVAATLRKENNAPDAQVTSGRFRTITATVPEKTSYAFRSWWFGDRIRVEGSAEISDQPLDGDYTIDAKGKIKLGDYGEIEVRGLSDEKVEEAIRKALRVKRVAKQLSARLWAKLLGPSEDDGRDQSREEKAAAALQSMQQAIMGQAAARTKLDNARNDYAKHPTSAGAEAILTAYIELFVCETQRLHSAIDLLSHLSDKQREQELAEIQIAQLERFEKELKELRSFVGNYASEKKDVAEIEKRIDEHLSFALKARLELSKKANSSQPKAPSKSGEDLFK